MREKQVRCFSSAALVMKGSEGYFASPAFHDLRWTLAGDQRDDRMLTFCRKLLKRLDGMGMPFYPRVGLMDLKTARARYVSGADPWPPMNNPFLDGVAIEFSHCIIPDDRMHPRQWALFAEIGFDVARLAHIPVMWGGFSDLKRHGLWHLYDGSVPDGWFIDRRTYGARLKSELPFQLGQGEQP